MNVGTVVEQLYANARGKLRGQRLGGKSAASDGLAVLAYEQRQRVLHLAHLALQVYLLCLHAVVGCLGTLHGRGAVAHAVLVHELHLLPGLTGQLLHVADNLNLAVEHQQRVVEVGNARHYVALHHSLVVLGGKELHLCRPLHAEQVAEQVGVP